MYRSTTTAAGRGACTGGDALFTPTNSFAVRSHSILRRTCNWVPYVTLRLSSVSRRATPKIDKKKNGKKKNRDIPMKTDQTSTRDSTHHCNIIVRCTVDPARTNKGEIKTKQNVAGERVKT